jgi:hypothetical protein
MLTNNLNQKSKIWNWRRMIKMDLLPIGSNINKQNQKRKRDFINA